MRWHVEGIERRERGVPAPCGCPSTLTPATRRHRWPWIRDRAAGLLCVLGVVGLPGAAAAQSDAGVHSQDGRRVPPHLAGGASPEDDAGGSDAVHTHGDASTDASVSADAGTRTEVGTNPGTDAGTGPTGGERAPRGPAKARTSTRSSAGTSTRTRSAPSAPERIRYEVERIVVEGNGRTQAHVIKNFVPLEPGDMLDVDDPEIQSIRWRLLGTGWFDSVDLRLRRGSHRGAVVLVVEVEERNTLVIRQITLGVSEGLNNSLDESSNVVPYGGISIVERNLLGLGMSLGATVLASKPQQGFRLDFMDPGFLGSDYLLSSSLFYNNAREFFGTDPLVAIRCPEDDEECPAEVEANNAVVLYRRGGISLGTGTDLGANTRMTLEWQGERVNVRVRPEAASETRGGRVVPIDFSIQDGVSYVSLLRLGLLYDHRNDPALPTRGTFVRMQAEGASRVVASDYDFLRIQALARRWFPLPWDHYVRIGAFAGAIFGRAPFFYKFHVSDLTDLIPSRVLEMQLDRRAPPNFLNTAVGVMRTEEFAARFDVEYGLHLFRGGEGFVRAVSAYSNLGLYALADFRDFEVATSGYDGISRVPIDLTFDLGLRIDTNIGVFQLGFSNALGFVAL